MNREKACQLSNIRPPILKNVTCWRLHGTAFSPNTLSVILENAYSSYLEIHRQTFSRIQHPCRHRWIDAEAFIPLKGVFAGQWNVCTPGTGNDLFQEALWGAHGFRWMFTVTHFHTGKAQQCIVPPDDIHDGRISIPCLGVVIPSRQFCCMRTRLKPPMHTSQFYA